MNIYRDDDGDDDNDITKYLFLQEYFYGIDSVDHVLCLYSRGQFQREAIVTCYTQRGAQRIRRHFDDLYVAGSHLRVDHC